MRLTKVIRLDCEVRCLSGSVSKVAFHSQLGMLRSQTALATSQDVGARGSATPSSLYTRSNRHGAHQAFESERATSDAEFARNVRLLQNLTGNGTLSSTLLMSASQTRDDAIAISSDPPQESPRVPWLAKASLWNAICRGGFVGVVCLCDSLHSIVT